MNSAIERDFYEEDEPIEKIIMIWENNPKALTGPPPTRAGDKPQDHAIGIRRDSQVAAAS